MLELADLQGLLLSGYGHQNHARFVFLRVREASAARAWLRALLPAIATAQRREPGAPKPPTHTNLAFTCGGLRALGLDDDTLATFPYEFRVGMAHPDRSRVLGDEGASAPERWQLGGPGGPGLDVLLLLYAVDAPTLERLSAETWDSGRAGSGLEEVQRQDSVRENQNEPFGFLDGISQPAIAGAPNRVRLGPSPVAAGEFVLGLENAYGEPSLGPTVARGLDPRGALPSLPGTDRRDLGRNGSYLVLRKLAQDVEGFWSFAAAQARKPDGSLDEARRTLIAAKLIGRWPSGAPLVLRPERDDAALGGDSERNNDFTFATDADGYACPIGAHIRRANPRDTLPPSPERSLAVSNRHRLIRRGRPYRDGDERGLIFIALNANLQRQFEFVQQSWLINPKFGALFDEQDPIVGNQNANGIMTLPQAPIRRRLHGLPRFVTVRGGGYFFLPSLRALRFLAGP